MSREAQFLPSVMLAGGVLCALLAAAIWLLLRRRHDARSVRLWSCGSLALAAGLTLIGQRSALPAWVGDQLAYSLLQWSLVLKLWALRRDLGLPLRVRWLSTATLVAMFAFHLAMQSPHIAPLAVLGTLTLVAGLVALAWHARMAGQRTPSPSGAVMAWAESIAAVCILSCMLVLLGVWPQQLALPGIGPFAVLITMAAFCAVCSNLAYLGMELDRLAASERRARAEERAAVTGRDEAIKGGGSPCKAQAPTVQ